MKNIKKSYNYCFIDLNQPGKFEYNSLNFCLLFEPFYIGKGKNNRWRRHKYNKNLSKKDKLINKLLIENYNNIDNFTIIYNKNSSNAFVENEEIKTILDIGRELDNKGPLLNILKGGNGMDSDWMIENNPMKRIDSITHSKTIKKTWENNQERKKIASERMSGKNNISAKTYILIYPNGHKETICDLKGWCKKNNYSINILRNWMGKGIIKQTCIKDKSFFRKEKLKLKNYEIKEIK